jgi:hypothetical protein
VLLQAADGSHSPTSSHLLLHAAGHFVPLNSTLGLFNNAAATCGSVEIVKILLGSNMPQMKPHSPTEAEAIGLKHLVSAVDKSGCSALHIAAIYGNRHCVRALLAAGARLEGEDDEGQTPLLSAVSFGHSDVVELLLAEVGYSELKLEFSNAYHRVQMLQRGTGWEKQVVVVNAGVIMTRDAIRFFRTVSRGVKR